MKHCWIVCVNSKDERWAWRAEPTGRGGLDIIAYRTKKEAVAALYEKRQLYGAAKLVKFVPSDT